MSAYANVADLARRVPWSELAEVAAQDNCRVDGELLRRTVMDADRSEYGDAEQAAAAQAMARLEQALDDATAEIDSYLAGRYGEIAGRPAALTVRCLDIAAYRLLGGEAQTERYLLYRRALAWLDQVVAGQLNPELGAVVGDADSASGVRIQAGPRVFDAQSLARY